MSQPPTVAQSTTSSARQLPGAAATLPVPQSDVRRDRKGRFKRSAKRTSKKMADVSASNTTEVPTEDPAKVQHDKPAETESSGEGGESQTAEADNGKGPNPDKLSDEEMAAIIDRLARSQEASEASAKKGEQIPSTPSGSRMMVKQGTPLNSVDDEDDGNDDNHGDLEANKTPTSSPAKRSSPGNEPRVSKRKARNEASSEKLQGALRKPGFTEMKGRKRCYRCRIKKSRCVIEAGKRKCSTCPISCSHLLSTEESKDASRLTAALNVLDVATITLRSTDTDQVSRDSVAKKCEQAFRELMKVGARYGGVTVEGKRLLGHLTEDEEGQDEDEE